MKQILCERSTSNTGMSTAGGYHGFPGLFHVSGTAESQARTAWMPAGTFRNFRVTVDTAPGAGKSWTLEIYKNAVATGLTVTIADTAVTATDSTNSFAVASGDYLSLRHTSSGTPTGSGGVAYSCEFEGSVSAESGYGYILGAFVDTASSRKSGVFWATYQSSSIDTWNNTNTANDLANIIPTGGAITGTAMRLGQSPGGGTKSFTSAIYHAPAGSGTFTKQDGTGGTVDTRVTCSGTTQNATGTYTLNVSAGDRVYYEVTPANSPDAFQSVSLGTTFTATRDGESIMGGWMKGPLVNSAVRYLTPHGEHDTADATEGNLKLFANPTSFGLSKFYVNVETAPGSGKSWEFLLRENGASPGSPLSITVSDTATTGSDLVDSYTIASGDTWELRSTPTGAPANSTISYAFVQYVSNYTHETTLSGGTVTITGGSLTSLTVADGLVVVLNDVSEPNVIESADRRGIRLDLNLNGTWRADIPIFDQTGDDTPDIDDVIQVLYYGQRIFKGNIVSVNNGPRAATNTDFISRCLVKGNRIATDQIEVTQTYTAGQTLKQIVTHLFDFYVNPNYSGYVLDPAMLSGPTLADTVTFDAVRLQDAYNRLTDLTGWPIRITPNDVIECFEVGTKTCTYALTAANLKARGAVTWERSRTTFYNQIHVRYGMNAGTTAKVTVSDATSVTNFGIYEKTFSYPDVSDADEATTLAEGLLRVYLNYPQVIEVRTRAYPMPLPGDTINLAFVARGVVDDDYLITRVRADDYKRDGLDFVLTCVSGLEASRSWTELFKHRLV